MRGLQRISGTPREIAVALRRAVREQVGLPLSVGVASTKLLAKVVSNEAKPDGLLVVAAGEEIAFLHPLPVGKLWGVGAVTAAGCTRTGSRPSATSPRGRTRAGRDPRARERRYLHGAAYNRDVRRVRAGRRRRSFGSQRALGRRRARPRRSTPGARALVDRVTRRMRSADRIGRTVALRLRFDDFARATRSRTLVRPDRRDGARPVRGAHAAGRRPAADRTARA